MKPIADQRDCVHLLLGHGDARRILPGVEFGPDPRARSRYKVANCTRAQPVSTVFRGVARGKVISVTVLSSPARSHALPLAGRLPPRRRPKNALHSVDFRARVDEDPVAVGRVCEVRTSGGTLTAVGRRPTEQPRDHRCRGGRARARPRRKATPRRGLGAGDESGTRRQERQEPGVGPTRPGLSLGERAWSTPGPATSSAAEARSKGWGARASDAAALARPARTCASIAAAAAGRSRRPGSSRP